MTINYAGHKDLNGSQLNGLCEAIRGIDPRKNSIEFHKYMLSLGTLLADSLRSDYSFPEIDMNSTDPTYFLVAYFDTGNLDEALWIYRLVRSLTTHVLLLDKFHESRNKKYILHARRLSKSIFKIVQAKPNVHYLGYSIDYFIGQFSKFWDYEHIIKSRILDSCIFSYAELRHFALSKASDSFLIYAKVLDALLPTFNQNVALILHYNQALLDILDDWEDIEEDVGEGMPNIYVMAALRRIQYNKLAKPFHSVRNDVLDNAIPEGNPIISLVNELQTSVRNIQIPECFGFLKSLTERYAETVRQSTYSSNSNLSSYTATS